MYCVIVQGKDDGYKSRLPVKICVLLTALKRRSRDNEYQSREEPCFRGFAFACAQNC